MDHPARHPSVAVASPAPATAVGDTGADPATGSAVVVLDDRVPHADAILAALTVPAAAIRVALADDGLERILAAVRAALSLGDRTLTARTLVERRHTLAAIGTALAGAPIELYACSVAEGESGEAFVAALAAAR
jgi:hypothetical protein